MEKTKVLFVSQEIVPYLRDSEMGYIGRYLPQGIQEKGKEIRTFMPRFGCINERRNQLHEVIRLSGMNIIINDNDHPLLIKVASISAARMQVYFIDNEEFFQRKFILHDKDNKLYSDNDERAVFFVRGVIETVKKLGWSPDIIHCHGWMSALMAVYIKKVFSKHPIFSESKIICSIYDDHYPDQLSNEVVNKLVFDSLGKKDIEHLSRERSYLAWMKVAVDNSDGIIYAAPEIQPELKKYVEASGLPVLMHQNRETYIEAFNNFYDKILVNEPVTM